MCKFCTPMTQIRLTVRKNPNRMDEAVLFQKGEKIYKRVLGIKI